MIDIQKIIEIWQANDPVFLISQEDKVIKVKIKSIYKVHRDKQFLVKCIESDKEYDRSITYIFSSEIECRLYLFRIMLDEKHEEIIKYELKIQENYLQAEELKEKITKLESLYKLS